MQRLPHTHLNLVRSGLVRIYTRFPFSNAAEMFGMPYGTPFSIQSPGMPVTGFTFECNVKMRCEVWVLTDGGCARLVIPTYAAASVTGAGAGAVAAGYS